MTDEMARRAMLYPTVQVMCDDLLERPLVVRCELRKATHRFVRRWARDDVNRHRAPCPHSVQDQDCPHCERTCDHDCEDPSDTAGNLRHDDDAGSV